jgi:hypothetical protein
MRSLGIVVRCAVLSVAAFSLSACDITSSTNSFASPSGVVVNRAKCSRSSDFCFKTAADTCGGPYQVIESESHMGGALMDTSPGPINWYTMTYRCGPSDGKMPTFAFRGGLTVNENINIHQQ